jgi:hypothetical protein
MRRQLLMAGTTRHICVCHPMSNPAQALIPYSSLCHLGLRTAICQGLHFFTSFLVVVS